MDFLVNPSLLHSATVAVPGDKSISHRALMLGSIAEGSTKITGFLAGEDCLATLAAFRAMGVRIDARDSTTLLIDGAGRGGLLKPGSDLDLGNSGTAMRLMCGLLAGQAFDCTLKGDASLSTRPMNRVVDPLVKMGARIDSNSGKPPLTLYGGQTLRGIEYRLPVASAQVKSCLLLAGLYAQGETRIFEPAITRDHTERMLRAMGADVETTSGWIQLAASQLLTGTAIEVPGDLSSAAFIMLAALLADDAEVLIEGVGVNPTRSGVIDVLRGMGADIELLNCREPGFEPIADIRVRSSRLVGGPVDPGLVSLAIDEFPVLFVAAAAASGVTRFSGIGELRVKESDRIAAMASGLRTMGIQVDETADGATVVGGTFAGGEVDSYGDHRIAMALTIAAMSASGPVTIRDVDTVATSYPGFADQMTEIGASLRILPAGATA
ncbi:MAG TPA: 3-phosphoshikimate 1-carboxyvinyltransferase [Woeseiaceae bacterium]|nr:3-phosphoshikimate 1-carboxyvinyltransferase [Woeseiaceae bacterium]